MANAAVAEKTDAEYIQDLERENRDMRKLFNEWTKWKADNWDDSRGMTRLEIKLTDELTAIKPRALSQGRAR